MLSKGRAPPFCVTLCGSGTLMFRGPWPCARDTQAEEGVRDIYFANLVPCASRCRIYVRYIYLDVLGIPTVLVFDQGDGWILVPVSLNHRSCSLCPRACLYFPPPCRDSPRLTKARGWECEEFAPSTCRQVDEGRYRSFYVHLQQAEGAVSRA